MLLAIAASFALGAALDKSGAAKMIADTTTALAGGHPWIALAIIYFVTLIVTELITNNAAAALMFPFALATARQLDVNYMPFVITVMMAASAGFATPIGYQTNLMVYGPGGYRFSDYLKVGVPLDILIGIVTSPSPPGVSVQVGWDHEQSERRPTSTANRNLHGVPAAADHRSAAVPALSHPTEKQQSLR